MRIQLGLIILSADTKCEMEYARADEEEREIQAIYGERHIGRRHRGSDYVV